MDLIALLIILCSTFFSSVWHIILIFVAICSLLASAFAIAKSSILLPHEDVVVFLLFFVGDLSSVVQGLDFNR